MGGRGWQKHVTPTNGNAFLRRVGTAGCAVSSDKRGSREELASAAIPLRRSLGRVPDFKMSRRVIVMVLNLERRVAPRLSSSRLPLRARARGQREASSSFFLLLLFFFFFSFSAGAREARPNRARYRSAAASSTSGCHDDAPSVGGRREKRARKKNAAKGGPEWSGTVRSRESRRAKRA